MGWPHLEHNGLVKHIIEGKKREKSQEEGQEIIKKKAH
jgi:hypothetical protein